MNAITPTTFAQHVENACGALVRDAAPAIDVDIEVLDETGRVVLSARRDPEGEAPRWVFATEISCGDNVVGTLRGSSASEVARALLDTLAHDIGARVVAAVDMDCMIARLATCYDELDLLYRMSSSLRPEERTLESCVALLSETIPHMDGAPMFLYLGAEDHLELKSEDGAAALEPLRNATEEYRAIVERLADAETGDGTERHRGKISIDTTTYPYVAFRILERSKVVGCVGVHYENHSEPPGTAELKILECLAHQLTDVVTRSAVLDELRDMLFNTIRSLVAAVDSKDVYTRGHSERVYRMSAAIGERMNLSAEDQQNLAWGALLHDIGKIAIPEEILRKTERLTNEELRMIQTHPGRGEEMLKPIAQLAGVLPAIRHHHERVDGRGYPDQLAGEDIPMLARIIAVADTFDALVSTRAYRMARTRDYAIREVERSAGTQLDASIVKVFLEIAARDPETVAGPEELSKAA